MAPPPKYAPDLKFQLQFVILSLEHEKIDFSIVIKIFCDVINIKVRYFEIAFKFDIFRFFPPPKVQHLETSFFQQKIEKIIRKKNDVIKFFWPKILKFDIFKSRQSYFRSMSLFNTRISFSD